MAAAAEKRAGRHHGQRLAVGVQLQELVAAAARRIHALGVLGSDVAGPVEGELREVDQVLDVHLPTDSIEMRKGACSFGSLVGIDQKSANGTLQTSNPVSSFISLAATPTKSPFPSTIPAGISGKEYLPVGNRA